MRDLQYYLSLPYTTVLKRDIDDHIFVARIQELEGCTAHGETPEQALLMLDDNKETWIQAALEDGQPIPQPADDVVLPSGKWLQRVPRTLHKRLVEVASDEGVSLNQFVLSILATAVGEKQPEKRKGSQLDKAYEKSSSHVVRLPVFISKILGPVSVDAYNASLEVQGEYHFQSLTRQTVSQFSRKEDQKHGTFFEEEQFLSKSYREA